MGISINIATANFTKFLGYASLPQTGLLGDYLFGMDQATSIANRANAAAPLTPGGSLAYTANSVTLDGTASGDFLSTGIVEMAEMTMVFVGRGSACGYMGSSVDGTSASAYTGLMTTNSANAQMRVRKNPVALFTTDVACSAAANLILIGRVKNEGGGLRSTLDCFQSSVQTTLSETDASPRGVNGLAIAVSNTYSAGAITAFGASLYNRYVTDAEVLAIAAYYREAMLGRGVTV